MAKNQVSVSPDYLKLLASKQDSAKEKAAGAAKAGDGIGSMVWISHGVFSGWSDGAMVGLEPMRKAAGEVMKNAANELAAKLRAAAETYESVDQELKANLDTQMLDR